MPAKKIHRRTRFSTYLLLASILVLNAFISNAAIAHNHGVQGTFETVIAKSNATPPTGLAAQFNRNHQSHANSNSTETDQGFKSKTNDSRNPLTNYGFHSANHLHDTSSVYNAPFSWAMGMKPSWAQPVVATDVHARLDFKIYHPPKA